MDSLALCLSDGLSPRCPRRDSRRTQSLSVYRHAFTAYFGQHFKILRRGTTFAKTNALLNTCKEHVPNMAIRTPDCGLSGRNPEDFELLKQWVSNTRFDRLGCFTYSHEENTHAHQLIDDLPAEVKQQRANEIMAIQSLGRTINK